MFKILIISQYFWPETFRINDIVKYLRKKNIEIDVITGFPNYPIGELTPNFKKNPIKYSSFHGAKIYRVPIYLRREGSEINLFLNYLSFVFSAIIFGYFYTRKNKYDIVFSFATSPITSSIPAIFFSKINKCKSFIWVLDLWPDILKELKIINNKLFYYFFRNFIIKIYQSFSFVLLQSKAFLERFKYYNIKINTSYFPSWSEFREKNKIIKDKITQFKPKDGTLNIVFTGNIGEVQNFGNILRAATLLKKHNIRWIIVGTGRKLSELKKFCNKHKISNFFFLGQKKQSLIPYYYNIADILFISLKHGNAISSTVPGKLQSYLFANKYILGFIDGEAKKIILDSKIGSVVPPNNYRMLVKKIIKLEKNRSLLKIQNNSGKNYLKINFNKKILLNNLFNKFISVYKSYPKIKLVRSLDHCFFKSNFVLSGLNLAFLGYFGVNRLRLSNYTYNWPDGIFYRKFFSQKEGVKKISGRKLLLNMKIPNFIKKIYIIGNLSSNSKLFVEKKYKKKVIHIKTPYTSAENIFEYCPNNFSYNDLIICTLPTPKQEYLAELIAKHNKFFKILCIGGALEMASGEDKPVPDYLDNFGLEFLWRLRKETLRRLNRLIITAAYFLYAEILFKYKSIRKVIIK